MTIECCSVRGRHARLYIFGAAILLSTINCPAFVRQLPDCGRGRQLSRLCRRLLVTRLPRRSQAKEGHWSLATVCVLLFSAANIFAQGSLAPPGAPAPTMKTLAQVEPRTSVDAAHTPGDAGALFIISQPGSYYLTANITGVSGKNGIAIAASGVTLDLMGFEMAGVASSSAGVFVSGTRTNLAIRNGTVRSWAGDGIGASSASNAQYQDLRLSANGLAGLNGGANSTVVNCTANSNACNGISIGDSSTVSGCAAQSNAGNGISTALGSTVSGCTAVANTLNGIGVGSACTVNGCTAYTNQQHGIKVGDGCTVKDCTARSNTQDGIFTAFDCTISSCTVRRNDHNGISADAGNMVSECTAGFNGAYGIQVTTDCLVRHNDCRQNGRLVGNGAGISADGAQNRIDDNNVTGNGVGIYCNPGNIITRNTAKANTLSNYTIVAGNAVGVIVAAPASGGIFGSTGGSGVGSTDPWANFSY